MNRCMVSIHAALMLPHGMASPEGMSFENDGVFKMEVRRHRLYAQGKTRIASSSFELRSQGQVVVTFAASLSLGRAGDFSSVEAKRQVGSIVAIGDVELTCPDCRVYSGKRLVFRAKDEQWILDGQFIDVAEAS